MAMEVFHYNILLLLFSIIFLTMHRRRKNKQNLPPSPPSLPIVGHLHHLLKKPPPLLHRTLKSLSDKYGPIMLLHFGSRPTLIVSSQEIAEECFTKNDVVFANRPKSIALKLLQYDYTTLGFSPYGDHWRNLRRVATSHIFSTQIILQYSSAIWTQEIRRLIITNDDTAVKVKVKDQEQQQPWKRINLTSTCHELVYNVMMRIAAGKRWSDDDESSNFKVVNTLIDVYDYLPFLEWNIIGGYRNYENKMERVQEERDKFLQDLVDEGRRKMMRENARSERRTVVESLLSLQETEPEYYTDEIIKGMIQIMFTAGTDISAAAMQWVMSLLLNHPEVLQKAKAEIYNRISPGKLIEDSDLPNLPYLRSIINETLRIFPPAPLLLPHFTSEDCTINGYKIPKETTVLINTWAIHRDPNVWEDPNEFRPERFEGINDQVGNSDHHLGFKFLTFGKGKRSCPGSIMAIRFITLLIGTLIQNFDWKRLGSEMVDMEEKPGLTMHRFKPLEAFYRPSISCHD